MFVILEDKEGYGWWLWAILGRDTVVYVLDASRSHTVPENHSRADSRGVLVVDRYSAYKAMSWVDKGILVLAFCWAHVRRDFIKVGKGWPQLKTWALEWLRRIRVLYKLNDRRLAAERDSVEFKEADDGLRQAVAAMKTQMETELARTDLATPCRKALESLQTPEMADVVPRGVRGGRRQSSGGYPAVLALEHERREEEGVQGHRRS